MAEAPFSYVLIYELITENAIWDRGDVAVKKIDRAKRTSNQMMRRV